jgi:hypothetical protein
MRKYLPYELKEVVVSVCGQEFWYKAPINSFFLFCGVPPEMYDRFAEQSKYMIARHILEELEDRGDEACLTQRRIATKLALPKRISDENVLDRDAAASSLRQLETLAVEQKLIVKKSEADAASRRRSSEEKSGKKSARDQSLDKLHGRLRVIAKADGDPQSRGYDLQSLLKELFAAWETDYRPHTERVTCR